MRYKIVINGMVEAISHEWAEKKAEFIANTAGQVAGTVRLTFGVVSVEEVKEEAKDV